MLPLPMRLLHYIDQKYPSAFVLGVTNNGAGCDFEGGTNVEQGCFQ